MIKLIPGSTLPADLQQKLEVACAAANGRAGQQDRHRITELLMKGVRERERMLRRSKAFAALRVCGLSIEKR